MDAEMGFLMAGQALVWFIDTHFRAWADMGLISLHLGRSCMIRSSGLDRCSTLVRTGAPTSWARISMDGRSGARVSACSHVLAY